MKPLKVDKITFKDLSEESRIGTAVTLNLTPKKHLDYMKFEKLLYDTSYLPVYFDASATFKGYYPEYFLYTNVFKYIQVTGDSQEFNVRHFEHILEEIELDEVDQDVDLFQAGDKYISADLDSNIDLDAVFFMPGSNMKHIINHGKLDELMHYNPDMVIKPHPLSSEHTIYELGLKYGYDRIVEKEISAESVLEACSKVFYCDTSEIGIKAMYMGKATENINDYTNKASLTYFHIYHILRSHPEDDWKKLIYNFFTNPRFGYFDVDKPEDILYQEIQEFLISAKKLDKFLRPRVFNFSSDYSEVNCSCQSGCSCNQ
tara:strand:+ start:890 stop:1837 length:948 start_codon:yes stop_codon:yes gene_type:complete